MTSRKDLKRHIRARQAKTGESYSTARLHVLGERLLETEGADPQPEPERVTAVVLKCNESSIRVL